MLNTLILASAVAVGSVPAGALLAMVLVRTDLPGRRAALVTLGLMPLVPLYLVAAAWMAGFGLQEWYPAFVGAPPWLQHWTGAIWIHTAAALPWVVLIVGAGLWLVEPELEEQALLDARAWRVFCRVTLRRALPAIGVAALWVAVSTAGEMTVTDLFAVRTYAEEIYTELQGWEPHEALQLALLPGSLLLLGLTAAGLVLCGALAPRDRPLSLRGRPVFRLGPWRWLVGGLVLAALAVLVAVPLANLFYQAGMRVRRVEDVVVRAGPCPSARMIIGAVYRDRRELGWSLGIGSLAATAALAVAIALGWLARRRGPWALPLVLLAAAGLVVPGPIVGLAIIELLNRPGHPWLSFLYSQSILAPWLAMTWRGLPPALLVAWHALQGVPEELLQTAAVDGAGRVARLFRVALPAAAPALGAAWLLAFAAALGELAATILVKPPGVTTLSVHIFGLLHFGVQDRVAGICLALVALCTGITAGIGLLLRFWTRRRMYNDKVTR